MIPIRRLRCSRRVAATAVLSLLVLGATAHATPGHVQAIDQRASTKANTLTIGLGWDVGGLDPVVMVLIYDQLIRVGNDGTSLVPDLATSWSMSKDGTVYTFHLRPGVVFHNGQKLTAEDVRFCLDRARNPKESWSWTLAAIKKVEAPDPATVRVTLKHPWAPFLSDVSLFDTGIYPEAYFKKVGASYMTAHPIGTGPYMFASWKRGQYLRLKKNPHYWMAAKFPMQYVEYDLIPNDNTRLLKVEAGELDVDNVLPYNLIAQVKNNPSIKVVIDRSTQTNYLVPNHKVAPFGDVKVRQAITHAIDRAALVKAVLYGYGTPANSFMPRGAIDYDPNIPVPSYDLALARKLLSQSTVPHGFTMNFEVGSGDTVGNQTAVIFKSEVAPLGIKVNIKPMDPTTLFNNQDVGKYSFTNNLWTNDIPDPDELVAFSANYAPGSWNFFTWYHNPEVSRLSHEAEQTNDAATRKRLYYQIQEIWAREQWFFALYYPPFVNAVSSRVQGFHESPLGYFVLQGVHKT